MPETLLPTDVIASPSAAEAALRPVIDRDWSVRAGQLEWEVEQTITHMIGTAAKYALYLASRCEHLSTGEMLTAPGLSAREQARLRRLQRRLARAGRGSARRATARTAVARLRARETDRRKDWAEKTSTGIARRFDVIRVEDRGTP